ncbi:hypothetical protein VC83_02051 [Pseudogymnoascus destructans]|uniref:Piwi domain-containing protein n=2 Tax=Pseudogymnoascus destructans TaxID=655981 RepID=L8FUD3_PSED2|nr:uncharacterized protein VC83_02051 [Pseudogymnoascus destructans]ELR04129.1 hypothetical protein GMDG_01433 [Pseudogymnoascus destructans 20631-21]OAF61634.1 hypothetical protein VC83_02051 [Pseudogymnoascus destructans]
MSGYNDRGGYRDRGGYQDRGGRDHQRRDRSRSPGREGGPRGDRFREPRGGGGRGGYQGNTPGDAPRSNLPELPNDVPIPEGARQVPYPDLQVRGTVGEKVMVQVNHHTIESLPTKAIYQYEFRFRVPEDSQLKGSDKVSSQQLARVLMTKAVATFLKEDFVFDGVSLGWSPHVIVPVGTAETNVVELEKRRDGKPNSVEVSVRSTGVLPVGTLVGYIQGGKFDLNPAGNESIENILKWIQAVFRKDPATRFITRPNSSAYFDRSPETTMMLRSTKNVLEARRGVFQSMQLRFGRITLNIDTATTPFWVPGVCLIDTACALMGTQTGRLEGDFLSNPEKFFVSCGRLRGSFFNIRHLTSSKKDKKIRLTGFSQRNAMESTFEERAGDDESTTQTTSVSDYFERKYNIKLQFPRLPLASTRFGDFPLEVCFSADGERYKEVLQGQETADFIKFATAPAYERKKQIQHGLRLLSHHDVPTIAAHGFKVNTDMMSVKARILPAPRLTYGGNRPMTPRDGRWNLRGLKFLRPSTIKSWVIVYVPARQPLDNNQLERFGSEMVRSFTDCGMTVPREGPPIIVGNPFGNLTLVVKDSVARAHNKFGVPPDVIFIILQGASVPIYKTLKAGLDVHIGIASQVMLQEKALSGRGSAQYLANIAMKVNVKLGGTNCIAEEPLFKAGRCMLLGGDISHAAPGALRSVNPPPSTAALVGTWDRECTAYTAVASIQESLLGSIANVKPMMAELLKRYAEKNNGLYPQHIVYYRDGVSESEFQSIKTEEGLKLRELCQELGAQAKITIIVAIKRHHTRFFADRDIASKLGNVPCGTVVENSSTINDAFIIAHPDLQGTKRPTRYVTIVDENNMGADAFQRLTFNLCSSYARATTSVAVCPPVYYADQACERARLHLMDADDGKMRHGPVHANLRWNMYWQ